MNAQNKIIVSLGVIALMAAGCNWFGQSNTPNPSVQTNQTTDTSQVQQNVVSYTDSGFSPSVLTIKKGDTVVFKNSASVEVRVASNPHPIHNGYPTTGGCVSSTFDSCSSIAPGQSWSFKFDIVGSWGYHNHFNPGEGGTIIVQNSDSAVPPTSSVPNKPSSPVPAPVPPAPTPSPAPSPSPAPY